MRSCTPFVYLSLLGLVVCPGSAQEAVQYQKAPPPISEILNAKPAPRVTVSPDDRTMALMEWSRYPTIAEMARPVLGLGGIRFDPGARGPHPAPSGTALRLMDIESGRERVVRTPPGARLSDFSFSPTGERFAFSVATGEGVELWTGETARAAAARVAGVRLNGAGGVTMAWMPGGKGLLCLAVPANQGAPPSAPAAPEGPVVQESTGRAAPVRTYQDLLANRHDEALFDYYMTSQVMLVEGGRPRTVGLPGTYISLDPSPSGEFILVDRLMRPYSYLMGAGGFPRSVEVWRPNGELVRRVAQQPSAEGLPIGGVLTGPRSHRWQATAPATLIWVEALDGGDPRKKVEHRDRLVQLQAPFADDGREMSKVEWRFSGLSWLESGGEALLTEFDRDRRWRRTWLFNPGTGKRELLWDLSVQDRYNDPGSPMTRRLPNGSVVIRRRGDEIFLDGEGASPTGLRPFLDRFHLGSRRATRLWQAEEETYESVAALLRDDAGRILTVHEKVDEPPNYFVRSLPGGAKRQITRFPDPAPQLRGVTRRLVSYRRSDGVPLSFTLYLPPGHREGQRLPTVVWAYPREFNDPSTAGQVTSSPHRFTTISGMSHLFFLTQGYAVLDDAAMPVVGPPETANDTFVQQIVESARAAIDKAVELGVTDRERVGVGGHSYGAFMTANLLAHSDLFRAGIARSGAYNRSLTPFGFQNERRTLWEAPEVYTRMSPFFNAQKINEPILLIHGAADDNPGTFPIQSERLFHALQGTGGRARFVSLPHESHGYRARESVEHTLWEMVNWFDRYVKPALPAR